METADTTRGLKARALEELRAFWIIALYLWLFLGSFTAYRKLILAESGVTYVHYGVALVQALVIAKVVLIGRVFGFTRRFEDAPLVLPVLYKSAIFALLMMLFGVLEHLFEGWIHDKGLLGALHDIDAMSGDEIGARMLTLTVAFVPFFAFAELGRVLGMRKLARLFFAKPESLPAGESGRNH